MFITCSSVVRRGKEAKQSVSTNERQNTMVSAFDTASPSISAFEIHEWIHEHLRTPEQEVNMMQMDGTRRQVYIKMIDIECVQALLQPNTSTQTVKSRQ